MRGWLKAISLSWRRCCRPGKQPNCPRLRLWPPARTHPNPLEPLSFAGERPRRSPAGPHRVGHRRGMKVEMGFERHQLVAPRVLSTPTRLSLLKLPLFWRLLGVNLVVVLGGALVGTWLTQRLVLSGTFTPFTHALLVLAALALS